MNSGFLFPTSGLSNADHDWSEHERRNQVPDGWQGWQERRCAEHVEPALVAEPAGSVDSPPELSPGRSHGKGLQLRRGVQEPRPESRETGHLRADDHVAGLVAGRLRPLWSALHPDGVAQRGHLPHQRRPRRRRRGHAALCAPQQLARQREPRQGAPAALADQAEIRPEDLLGRPDDPRRELRPRIDGLQDGRFRRRTRGRLGASGRHLLGF